MNLKVPKDQVLKRVDEALEYMNISHLKDIKSYPKSIKEFKEMLRE